MDKSQLEHTFASLARQPDANPSPFVVAATAFGSGIDFLNCWSLFDQHLRETAIRLHYIAFEPNPFEVADLRRLLALMPKHADRAKKLEDLYPPLIQGLHRCCFDGGRIRLTLFFGERMAGLAQVRLMADAWLLNHADTLPADDPATLKSRQDLIRQLSWLSKQPSKPATGCTYRSSPTRQQKTTVILGAGLAGCLLAHNLTRRGQKVLLIEQHAQPGLAASGNRQGALYIKLGRSWSPQNEWALAALLFAQRYYAALPAAWQVWHPTGLLDLAVTDKALRQAQDALQQQSLPSELVRLVQADEASQLAGVKLAHAGLYFPGGGWLDPAKLCRQLVSDAGCNFLAGQRVQQVTALQQANQPRFQIQLASTGVAGQNLLMADQLVICGGAQSQQLLATPLPVRAIRGQVSRIQAAHLTPPNLVVCGDGYVNPAYQGLVTLGATFDLHSQEAQATPDSDIDNLTRIGQWFQLTTSEKMPTVDITESKVGFRCTSNDYLPYAGPLPISTIETSSDPCLMTRVNGSSGAAADLVINHPAWQDQGLYLFSALGSKGLAYAPLLAEWLADRLCSEPQALPRDLAARLQPARGLLPRDSLTKARRLQWLGSL